MTKTTQDWEPISANFVRDSIVHFGTWHYLHAKKAMRRSCTSIYFSNERTFLTSASRSSGLFLRTGVPGMSGLFPTHGASMRNRNSVPGYRQTGKACESQELPDRLRGRSHRFSGRPCRRNELPGGSTKHVLHHRDSKRWSTATHVAWQVQSSFTCLARKKPLASKRSLAWSSAPREVSRCSPRSQTRSLPSRRTRPQCPI